ncbi:MAG: SAM-dependent methyltransferase [Phycisphaerae bacterium]|nr:SAM-dependent methyltransferase [Phycisphaerae bacterium]HBZ96450.1 SAM-dependent methyltransferase [Phycisphaerales bacterium]|tara:strand:+ start:287 stop:1129 length:843 start_codon:yes stop_codon:yes gene_type:complete
MSRRPSKKKKQPKRKGWKTAKTADILELYELSVQEPGSEVDIIDQVWQEQRGRTAKILREDFCGTAAISIEWVKRREENNAFGIDLDSPTLEWTRKRIPDRLDDHQQSRIDLIEGDVLTSPTQSSDTILATNFSYFIFKTREEVRNYFRIVHEGLVDDGLFILDAYGGSDSYLEMTEDRDLDGFTYTWDQNFFDPITGDVVNHIHFKFPDGTKIKKAFTYEWRLWTLPEIQELLLEAGFKDTVVYWEGTDDETGEGDGEWAVSKRGEACEGWVAYIVGIK